MFVDNDRPRAAGLSRVRTQLLDRQGITILGWALAAGVVCFGYAAMNPIWMPDDFGWQVGDWHARAVDTHGRWALRLWGELTAWNPMPGFSWAIALMAYPLCGLLLVRYWRVEHTLIGVLVATLFVSYPGFIEAGRWDLLVAAYPLAHLLTIAALLLARRSWLSALLAGGLLTVAIATYQTLASFAAVAVTLSIALLVARDGLDALRQQYVVVVLRPLLTGVTGVIGYAVSLLAYAQTGRTLGRGLDAGVNEGHDWLRRVVEGGSKLVDALASGMDTLHGGVLVPCALIVTLAVSAASVRSKRHAQQITLAAALAVVAGFAAYTHQYIAAVLQDSGWYPRAATGLALLLPFAAALGDARPVDRPWLRQGVALVFGLLVVNWAAYASGFSYEWHLKSLRTTADAHRILERVQANPGYRPGTPIVFPYGYDYAWYRFDARRASTEFMPFFDARVPPADADQIALARERARDLDYWPAANSVRTYHDMAVVAAKTPLALALRAGRKPSPTDLWQDEVDARKHD